MRICFLLRSKDPFAVLGLSRAATKAEVKMRYRELARRHHPDSGTGDTEKMEQVNKAYNFLLKEGAYERLHVGSSVLRDGVRHPTPFSPNLRERKDDVPTESVFSDEEAAKLSALDPSTERVTPQGKYMYQSRDDGKWVTLDRPLVRSQQPRYASFSAQSEMSAELRKRAVEQEKEANAKTMFQRGVDRLSDSGDLPSRNSVIVRLYLLLAAISLYFVYQRTFAWGRHHRNRSEFYSQLEAQRNCSLSLYEEHRSLLETSVVAAAILFITASENKKEADPVVPPTYEEYFRSVRPPRDHFHVVSGG
ncbi:DnaJ domain [Trypanosoma vivax]|uniref:Putative chaperone protein DNAj n=1 Tax=Trypanosoma vivax (strain Y486) TaxID=1055687 RepID=G0TX40_TRYVY|nr:DnaJ domain [Trypanosoma vivax]CCC48530.1 putative chaperone protein DNAj [Trypanosoma vivax Y486]